MLHTCQMSVDLALFGDVISSAIGLSFCNPHPVRLVRSPAPTAPPSPMVDSPPAGARPDAGAMCVTWRAPVPLRNGRWHEGVADEIYFAIEMKSGAGRPP